jgi:hypothetical protein
MGHIKYTVGLLVVIKCQWFSQSTPKTVEPYNVILYVLMLKLVLPISMYCTYSRPNYSIAELSSLFAH